MPTASAVRNTEYELDEEVRRPAAVASEQARYEPRFRVVKRKPLVTQKKRSVAGSLTGSVLLAAVPVFCLLVYVLFWTLTMRGTYYRDRLQGRIDGLIVERRDLEAEKHRLQSAGLILGRAAAELGMRPATQREFAQLPSSEGAPQRRVARP